MTRSCTHGRQSDEVHLFQHHAVWNEDIACGYSAPRRDYSVARQHGACRKPTHKPWPQTAAARNIKVQIRHHQKKDLFSLDCFVAVVELSSGKSKRIQRSSHRLSGSIRGLFIYTASAPRLLIMIFQFHTLSPIQLFTMVRSSANVPQPYRGVTGATCPVSQRL